jgi:uncharacterized protein (TIGR00369 family)
MVHPNPSFPPAALAPAALHPFCFVCGGSNPMSLGLRCEPQADGRVAASFIGHSALEGYPGRLHGGVIAALLDGAMTHCLFAHGIEAVTAELNVRYLDAVSAGAMLTVQAWLTKSTHGLYQLEAEIAEAGVVKVSATGKFMKPHE